MIVENQYLNELREIWKYNNQNYILDSSNKLSLYSPDMLKMAYVENDIVLGFITVYEGQDFCKKEGFSIKIDDLPEKTIYVWEVITKKGFENRGIATELFKYVINKFAGYTIYSCVEPENSASIALHKKMGFTEFNRFEKYYDEKGLTKYIMLKR